MRFTFAVIADSHFHPEGGSRQSGYPSDALHNDRNRAVAAALRAGAPDFAIHLGDVPHPVPGLAAHREALAVARATYEGFGFPFHVVPGNHDVGDKPSPWSPALLADDRFHAVFEEHWGPPWRAFDHQGCRFLLLDSPILGTGQPREAAQAAWLDRQLASLDGRRLFAFIHYPPYLGEPDEPEHYDNLAEPERTELLDKLRGAGAEALFAGHAHHFFYNRFGQTDFYILPSTAFVRPGFAELCRVGPLRENGRDDGGKLGFFFVHVTPDGYDIEPVRSGGDTARASPAPALRPGQGPTPPNPLGIFVRHGWDRLRALPTDNLDPFCRKDVRNDLPLSCAWELGVRRLRLPLDDLGRADSRERLRALRDRGHSFVFFTASPPKPTTWALIERHADLVEALEWIAPFEVLAEGLANAPGPGGPPLWVSPVGRKGPREGAYFSHFPSPGLGGEPMERAELPAEAAGAVWRVDPATPPLAGVARAVREAARLGLACVCHVWLPRGSEHLPFTDDGAVARRVAEAFLAAKAHPEAVVFLDTFMDHDRGYFPRHGLIDRRSDPRPGFRVLRHLNRLFPGPCAVEPAEGGFFVRGAGRRGRLLLGGAEGGVDLDTGAPARARGPAWVEDTHL